MPASTADLAIPYPVAGDDPGVQANFQALAERVDALGGGIKAMTTTTRNALSAGDKWAGRTIWNVTTGIKERWNGTTWVPDLRATGISTGKAELDGTGAFGGLVLEKDGTTAAADSLGSIDFYGLDGAANRTRFARTLALANDVTNGSEDGELRFYVQAGGAEVELLRLIGGSVVAPWLMQNRLANSDGTRSLLWGSGTPNGTASASVGSFYLQTNGGNGFANPVLWFKKYGTGSTGWRPVGEQSIYKSNDQGVSSSTTLVDATSMSLAVYTDATDMVFFEALLLYYGNTTNDIKVAITTSTALRLYVSAIGPGLSTVSGEGLIMQTALSSAVEMPFGAYSSTLAVLVRGGWIPNATATNNTIKVQFAQNTSHATPTTMAEGSQLRTWYM